MILHHAGTRMHTCHLTKLVFFVVVVVVLVLCAIDRHQEQRVEDDRGHPQEVRDAGSRTPRRMVAAAGRGRCGTGGAPGGTNGLRPGTYLLCMYVCMYILLCSLPVHMCGKRWNFFLVTPFFCCWFYESFSRK